MTKSEVLRAKNGCLAKAADDEPIFVLRANDPVAAQVIRWWASAAVGVHEDAKIATALAEADLMEEWRQEHVGKCDDNDDDRKAVANNTPARSPKQKGRATRGWVRVPAPTRATQSG